MEFGFSFDAAHTIDIILYLRGSTKEGRDGQRKMEKT